MSWAEDPEIVESNLRRFVSLRSREYTPADGPFNLDDDNRLHGILKMCLTQSAPPEYIRLVAPYGYERKQYDTDLPWRDFYVWRLLRDDTAKAQVVARKFLGDLRVDYWLSIVVQRANEAFPRCGKKFRQKYSAPPEPKHVLITITDLQTDLWESFINSQTTEKETLLCLPSQVSLDLL